MIANLSVPETYQGEFGFVGQGGAQEAIFLERSLGSVEARSEATFEKNWHGSLVNTWSLLFGPWMRSDRGGAYSWLSSAASRVNLWFLFLQHVDGSFSVKPLKQKQIVSLSAETS